MKIAHIINPLIVDRKSDLFYAQPVTFETMRIAKEHSKGFVNVELFATHYIEDSSVVPSYIASTGNLERSVMDIAQFKTKRKLPLIKDILEKLYSSTDADYLIYTNVDIALMPYFYVAIKQFIDKGYDSFVINRRTISEKYRSIDEIALMYSETGKSHPGYDCFVFKRDFYSNFILGTACIGANYIGMVLVTNLICNASNFVLLKDLHLTFHIGDDRSWKNPEYNDYDRHNKNELLSIMNRYKTNNSLKDHSLIQIFTRQLNDNRSSKYKKLIKKLLD